MRWLRRSGEGDEVPEPRPAEPRLREAWAGETPGEPGHLARALGEGPTGEFAVGLDPDELDRSMRRAVSRALAEDLGVGGDLTSRACVPAGSDGQAEVVARASGVLSGGDAIAEGYAQVDGRLRVEPLLDDSTDLRTGDVVARIRGPLRSILTGERAVLNLLGHLSGVATTTRQYVDAVGGTRCAIRDTWETTPGLRLLEKAAVRAGGGTNQRIGLFDGLVVTDSHVLVAGDVAAATRAALERAGGAPVQVQVNSREELEAAIQAGARELLVHGVSPDEARQAVAFAQGRARIEVSGGITLDNVRAYADAGVDAVAVGDITHPSRRLDFGLDTVGIAGPPDLTADAGVPAATADPPGDSDEVGQAVWEQAAELADDGESGPPARDAWMSGVDALDDSDEYDALDGDDAGPDDEELFVDGPDDSRG